MRISLILVLLLTFCAATSIAQTKGKQKKADEYFDAGEYFKAEAKYKKLITKTKDREQRALMSFKLAECYRHLNQPKFAITWYKAAIKGKVQETKAYLHYADVLKMVEKYDEAEENYRKYKELVPDDPRGDRGLQSCQLAAEWKANPTQYIVEPVKAINSKNSDFSAAYSKSDHKEIYFTSTREGSTGDEVNTNSGMNFSDIFISRMDNNNSWSEPVPLDENINTMHDEGSPCLNKNKITMYFTRCISEKGNNTGCKIYMSTKSGGAWGAATEVKLLEDSSITVGHPAISDDELTLYFVAVNLEGGQGGKDIWRTTRERRTDEWGEPRNIGTGINTSGDEMYPFLRNDSTLYFSSNGHVGLGGLDIYKAVLQSDGTWSVENMRSPINSAADDFGITFQSEGERGFFASARETKGGDDLYSFTLPELEFTLRGFVMDEKTSKFLGGATVKLIGSDGSATERITANDGSFRFQLKERTDYLLLSTLKGYLNGKGQVTTKGLDKSAELRENIMMTPIDNVIELPNIEYDYNDTTLRPESMVSLDKLIETLNDNPTITIELMAHTDSRGSAEYNKRLAQGRANSVVHYLVQNFISSDRLTASGIGEDQPRVVDKNIAKNYPFLTEGSVLTEDYIKNLSSDAQQEAAHQLNRRTEFKVLTTNYKGK